MNIDLTQFSSLLIDQQCQDREKEEKKNLHTLLDTYLSGFAEGRRIFLFSKNYIFLGICMCSRFEEHCANTVAKRFLALSGAEKRPPEISDHAMQQLS